MRTDEDMTEMVSTLTKFQQVKRTFHDTAQEAYPGVQYPEMCWLFDMVLDVDAKLVVQEPISKKSYVSFVYDDEGNRELHMNGRTVRVQRKFTPRQQELVREWWPLLPDEMKID